MSRVVPETTRATPPLRIAERVWIEAEVERVWEDNGDQFARLYIPHAVVMDAKARRHFNGIWIYDPTLPVEHLIRRP